MERYIFDIPAEQVSLITQLMSELKISYQKIEQPADEELSLEQHAMIMEGIRQADAGETITFEELKKQAEEWLTK